MNTCPHWSVEIKVDTESKLYISHNELSGVDNIMDYTEEIRHCANSLLGFIGELDTEPKPEPKGYALVGLVGENEQKVVDNRLSPAKQIHSDGVRISVEQFPVICIVERE